MTSQVSFLVLARKSPFDSFPLLSPENDYDDLLPSFDDLMTEPNPKRKSRPSRSTDAKASETPVDDDVTQPPPDGSSGKHHVKKKVRRER